MENSNRSGVENTFRNFFEGLDEAYQREMIKKMQKKPPDSKLVEIDHLCESASDGKDE